MGAARATATHRNVYRQPLVPGRGQRLQHFLQGRLHRCGALRQAKLLVAVVALKARGGALFPLRCQRIAHYTRGIDLLVQQACSGKAVVHAVHRDAIDRGARSGQGGFHLGLRQGGVGALVVQPFQRPGGPGGAHARRQSPGQGLVTRGGDRRRHGGLQRLCWRHLTQMGCIMHNPLTTSPFARCSYHYPRQDVSFGNRLFCSP